MCTRVDLGEGTTETLDNEASSPWARVMTGRDVLGASRVKRCVSVVAFTMGFVYECQFGGVDNAHGCLGMYFVYKSPTREMVCVCVCVWVGV